MRILLLLVSLIVVSCNEHRQKVVGVQLTTIDTIYKDFVIECKRREGFRPNEYRCPAGVKTIGYGQTKAKVKSITKQEATKMLHQTLDDLYYIVQKEIPSHNRNQQLAVTLLAYNIGLAKLKSYKLWSRIVNKQSVYSDWNEIKYYRPNGSKKAIVSTNLAASRKFELWLYQSDLTRIRNKTSDTIKRNKNI